MNDKREGYTRGSVTWGTTRSMRLAAWPFSCCLLKLNGLRSLKETSYKSTDHPTYMKLEFLLKTFNELKGRIVFSLKQGWMHGSIIPAVSASRHFSRSGSPREASPLMFGTHFQKQQLTVYFNVSHPFNII